MTGVTYNGRRAGQISAGRRPTMRVTMIDWLYTLPEILLVLVAGGLLAAIITTLPRLVRQVPLLAPSDANTDFVIRVQATLFTMCSLILAFTLVEADGNFRRVEALASAEASHIDRLDRLLARYDGPATAEIRTQLAAYVRSILQDDWPEILRGSESEKTRQAFAPVSRGVLALSPTPGRQTEIYSEMLRAFDAVAEGRDARINAAATGLPRIYWVVILFAALTLVLVSSTMHPSPFRKVILGCQMAVLGAFIGFVFVMDQPFKGETAVQTDHYTRALNHMETRPH